MNNKNIMIFGGEFYNKGAQAMSFITISRLKTQFPNHNILFVSELDSQRPKSELENYNFKIITSPFNRKNMPGENFVRKILGKQTKPNPKDIRHYLEKTEFLFDISGYELSSQWGINKSNKYLDRFNIAHQHGIKTFILPQSIGPFNYGESQEEMGGKLYHTLKSVEIIMPREPQGEQALREVGIYENVKQNPDIVLTNKEPINWNHIYKNKPEEKRFDIMPNSVVIVPNMRNFDHGNKEEVLELYREAVKYLLNDGKQVYLARHSHEDIKACRDIKDMFQDNDSVHLIEDDLSPTEFESMIEQFDFSIGSRFHSIVHSFNVGTPSIILGWAVKYTEIAKLFEQEEYVVDVRDSPEPEVFVDKVKTLNENFKTESKKINQNMEIINKFSDPFEYIFDVMDI